MPQPKKIIVVGVGNSLLSDEGIGPKAVERLKKMGLPERVKIFDAGVSLQSILSLAEGFDKMIVIDAVKGGDAPGTIYRFTLDELEQGKTSNISFKLSLHEMDVPRAIAMERLIVELPKEIVVIGMEPQSLEPGEKLSDALEQRIEQLIERVLKEIN
jgi:hydrogenase maturation protease